MAKNISRRISALFLAATVILGGVPVTGEELLSDGTDSEWVDETAGEQLLDAAEEVPEQKPDNAVLLLTDPEENSEESIQNSDASLEDQLSDGELLEIIDSEDTEETSGIRYILGRPMTEEEIEEQLRPAADLVELEGITIGSELVNDIPMVQNGDTERTRYDAREYGYITSVKRQSPFLNCWAYSLASLMETSLLTQGYGTYDLSEEHLSYFLANRENDPLGNTEGDQNLLANGDYHSGGNTFLGIMHLSTWSGMTTEERYPTPESYISQQLPEEAAYETRAFLKDAVMSDYSVTRMKDLLLQYHSVSVLINFSSTSTYYNASTGALSNPNSGNVNHAVTVVGWDDSYSKENFQEHSGVTEDGAWIVKNSWGASWGDQGYFYLSYEDQSIMSLVALNASFSPDYTNNYFYDGSAGVKYSTQLATGASVASIYHTQASDAGNGRMYSETLGEVVTAAATDNSWLSIQIYLGLTDETDPTSGVPAYETPITVLQSYAGLKTVSIPIVEIAGGTSYSIVITNLSEKTIRYHVSYREYSNGWIDFVENMESGQSFRNTGSGWRDTNTSNYTVRMRAHTKTSGNLYDVAWKDTNTGEIETESSEITLAMFPGLQMKLMPVLLKNGEEISDSYGFYYESSAEDIVSVSENGAVTVLTEGTADLTVRSKFVPSKTLTVHVIMASNAENLAVSVVNAGRIRIQWTAGANLDGYVLYRKEGNGEYKVRRSFPSQSTTEYYDYDVVSSNSYVKPGVTYTYQVAGYINYGGKRKILPLISAPSVTPQMATLKATVRAYNNSANEAYNTLTWSKEPTAKGYRLYRRKDDGELRLMKTLYGAGTVSYKDTNVQALHTYQYVVRAFRDVNGTRYYSPYQFSGKLIGVPNKTTVWTTKVVSNGISITWNRQLRAAGYEIYRKTAGGSYTKIATVTDTSVKEYIDKTAKKGVTYQYAVKAYVKEFYGTKYGAYTPGKAIRRQ